MAKPAHAAPKGAETNKDTDANVDVGLPDFGGMPSDRAIAQSIDGLGWLFSTLDDGGGGDADWPDDDLADSGNSGEPLDSSEKLDRAALSYGAAEDRRPGGRLRRLDQRPHKHLEKTILSVEEHFQGDEDAVFLAVVIRDLVHDALIDKDPWAFEWLFGANYVKTPAIPPRDVALRFFEAREVVLQTRVQYQMLRENIEFNMEFPTKGVDRIFLWQVTGLLRERGQIVSIDHTLTIMEQLWRNPGVLEAQLWELYSKHIVARPSSIVLKPERANFDMAMVFLDLAHIFSQNEQSKGWYFTGKNPAKAIEEKRRDLKRFNVETMNRGWSSWW